jgi:DNA-binding transcriptional LysR family regulator
MTQRAPDWNLYRSLLAVLRTGSLSAAARAIGLTQPTIGRHIDTLEQALDVPLFTRSQHGLAATEAALELRPYAESLEATTAALLRTASSHGGSGGTVRITASEIVGAEVLPPILAELREAHPNLVVELVLSNRTQDLLYREADIAVRMVRPSQQALLVRRIGEIALGLYAHRKYIERHGMPGSRADLGKHALIGFDQESAFIRSARARGFAFDRNMFALRTDNDLALLAAIRAGFGIGVCQAGIARRDPDLIPVLPGALPLKLEMWIAMHADLRGIPRCRIASEALAKGLSRYVASAGRSRAPP